jgi:hypothetical protein
MTKSNYITSETVTARTKRNRVDTTSRVEKIGAMNDRWKDALNRKDRPALLKLAAEYNSMGMRLTAKKVREDAG